METAKAERVLAKTEVGPYYVSTVFLGLDYNFSAVGEPILWESMTFENKVTEMEIFGRLHRINREAAEFDEGFCRYPTKEKALEGHDKIVEKLKTFVAEKNL